MSKITSYFTNSYRELKLVTWPKQDELLRMTVISVVFVLITATIIGGVDFGLTKAYQWLLSLTTPAQ